MRSPALALVGSTGVSVADLLPEGSAVLDVGAGWGASASLSGGEVPPPPPAEEAHGPHDAHDADEPAAEASPTDNPNSTPAEVRA
jgi:RND superfamily putative drug exporter